MARWFNKLSLPIWLFAVSLTAYTFAVHSAEMPAIGDAAASVVFPVLIATWILSDAPRWNHRLCYDFGTFAYFGWMIVLPAYVIQTRGWRAIFTAAGFAAVCALSVGVGVLLSELWLKLAEY